MPNPFIKVSPDLILSAAKRVPSSASMYARMQKALRDPECDLNQIIELVRLDTGLSAGVIQVSNNAANRRGETIATIEEAINRVGLREIQRLVGLTVAKQMFSRSLPLYRVGTEALWQNSLCVAVAASCLSQYVDQDEKIGYTLGMMRPIGRLILHEIANATQNPSVQPVPEKSTFADTHEWEMATFGTTEEAVMSVVLTDWGFLPQVCDTLEFYVRPTQDPHQLVMTALLHVACWIADSLGKGLACEHQSWALTAGVLEQAGLTSTVIETSAVQTSVELAEVQHMYHWK
ncbi:MAG TPA: HDOD domain-containing protein [Opitutaceae bacterium]|nr:HDOD domain-containing protein [Opitutaceae bacterium]